MIDRKGKKYKNTKHYHVMLDQNLKDRLDQIAEQRSMTFSGLLNELLENELDLLHVAQ